MVRNVFYSDAAVTIYHGDFRQILPDLSVDAIITDPPYGKEFLPLYEDLSRLSAHALKPGGSLLVMTGQSYLPEVMRLMTACQGLRYHWTLAYLTPGGQAPQIWPRKVNAFWKPVLWFVKGEYTGKWIGDVIQSKANDKSHHPWGQSESGMAALIDRFADADKVICDPFMGAGTTLRVAKDFGFRAIGIEKEERHCAEAVERLRQEVLLQVPGEYCRETSR